MPRSLLATLTVMACASGCFADPPPGSAADESSSGAAEASGTTTSGPSSSDTTADISDSSGLFGTTFGTTTGPLFETSSGTDADASTTDDPPPPICGCPEDALLCEDFETFNAGIFPGWGATSMPVGIAVQQVDSVCEQAFRTEIAPGESFSVLGRSFPNILQDDTTDVIRITGVIRVEAGCATNTPHRLLSARADGPNQSFRYAADIVIDGDTLQLAQATAVLGQTDSADIGDAVFDMPQKFELMLTGLRSGRNPTASARVGFGSVDRPLLEFGPDGLALNPVLGPFAFEDASMAGCAVEFDDVAVETLAEPAVAR